MADPLVSCICPTYGRVPDYQHLLEEAIESFVRQDYANAQLIVLNDACQQCLTCDAPGVHIVNRLERYPTLGDKYNAGVEAADGELICPWEDDDISLPWRISQAVDFLGDNDYWSPMRYWFLDGDGLHCNHPMGVSHNCSIYRKSAWAKVGGYPSVSGPQDAQFDGALRAGQIRTRCCTPLYPREWSYIYRWGVSRVHLSAFSDTAKVYANEGYRQLSAGRFFLTPHWRRDYAEMVASYDA